MRKQKGFSLIELLIVVAIIPANESSAVASIRTINTAMISYNSAYPTVGFSATLANLAGTSCTPPTSTSACLIDTQLATGVKSGYQFAAAGSGGPPASAYYAYGSPTVPNQSGNRSFCSVADAVVRYSTAALTSCAGTESPLQ
jgi:type IV pilus assembly protein PilA